MTIRVQFDKSAWSLLDDDPNTDKTGKKRIEKQAMEKLIKLYEKEIPFEIVISQPVLDELKKSKRPLSAINFIKKHSIPRLEYDDFYGFILGSPKHGILGKSPLGVNEHPESIRINSVERLRSPKRLNDKNILKHNINNDVNYLITVNTCDFDKKEIRYMIRLPSEFLKIVKKRISPVY